MAGLAILLANLLPAGTGSWRIVFMIAAALDLMAAILALVVLKPLRKRLMASDERISNDVTDFSNIPEYGPYVATDEYRSGLHYPAVFRELGELRGKCVLDVGTGNSPLPRLSAKQGAFVVAYDKSAKRIELARAHEDARSLGIEYVVATPQTFRDRRQFDLAVSVMVLPYAENVADLAAFFRSVNQRLIAGGKFVSVTLNPLFTQFETDFFIRRMTKLDGNTVKMESLKQTGEPGLQEPLFKRQYTKAEYERAAAATGMCVRWKPLTATAQAVAEEGEEFWRPVHETQPYALFIAQR